ncbi:hypothetical protein ACH5RR_015580 [Cinchona calisaya]|uniref:Uncharacterized protein n=1 Tax=Cinchona calisaya TaxID=153742 RepID=A0ABD2ZVG0_9GENT
MAQFSGSSSIISFDEMSAREHIMRGTNFAWHSTSFALEKQHIFTDDHNLSSFKFNYFMSLQSSYLSLQCEDFYVIEIYSPIDLLANLAFVKTFQFPPYRVTLGIALLDNIILRGGCGAIAMDEGTSSRKRYARQEVQDETPTDDHRSGHLSQQPQLDEMSDETPLLQRSRCLKKKFANDNFSWRPHNIVGSESSDNTISGPNQFELVAHNPGKPSDVTSFSNMEKRLLVMPTMPVLAQPVLCAQIAPSIFSVIAIASEQHCKAALGIGERIQQQILGTSFDLEERRVELVKELDQLEVEMQGADTEIRKVNDEMSRDQHLMPHLSTEQANVKNTPVVSSKDSEDLKALRISLEEE